MKEFRVVWEIDIQAEDHEDAAKLALIIQRDPESTATVFEVDDGHGPCTIDLNEEEEEVEQTKHRYYEEN